MQPIHVTFTFTEASYAQVSRLLMTRILNRQRKWMYVLAGILIAITAMSLITGRWQMLVAFLIPVAILIPMWQRMMSRVYKKAFDEQEYLHHPISYTFTEQDISSKSHGGDHTMPWETLVRVVEKPDFFLLQENETTTGFPVLKSGFADEAEMERFRELVRSKNLWA